MTEESGFDSVDFEIALTALLATLVTAYPSPLMPLYPMLKLAAVGLLAITLIKRVGIRNGFTIEDNSMLVLTYLMDPLTSLSFVYCCHVAVQGLTKVAGLSLSSDQLAMVVGIITIAVVLGLFLASELVFGDMLREAARIIDGYAAKHRGEALGYVLRRISAHARQQQTPGPTTVKAELTDIRFYDISVQDLSPDERSNVRVSWAVFSASVVAVVFLYLVIFLFATILFQTSWVVAGVLLLVSLLVGAFFEVWYSHYGLLRPEARHIFVSPLTSTITYAVLILMMT